MLIIGLVGPAGRGAGGPRTRKTRVPGGYIICRGRKPYPRAVGVAQDVLDANKQPMGARVYAGCNARRGRVAAAP